MPLPRIPHVLQVRNLVQEYRASLVYTEKSDEQPIELFYSPASHLQKVVYWIWLKTFCSPYWIRSKINIISYLCGSWLNKICSDKEQDENFSWLGLEELTMSVIFIPLAESAELAFLGVANRVRGCASFFFKKMTETGNLGS